MDQGCQYTSKEWTEALERYGIRISMEGRGRCKDNIWIDFVNKLELYDIL